MKGGSKSRGVEIIRYAVSAPAEAVAEVLSWGRKEGCGFS